MLNHSASLAMSTSIFKALPGDLISIDTHLVLSRTEFGGHMYIYFGTLVEQVNVATAK